MGSSEGSIYDHPVLPGVRGCRTRASGPNLGGNKVMKQETSTEELADTEEQKIPPH